MAEATEAAPEAGEGAPRAAVARSARLRRAGRDADVQEERVVLLLLERGRITPGQVEEATRTRSFLGGRVESYLLKLGFVDEATLGSALAEVYGVPFASHAALRSVPLGALAAVPPETARLHALVPFHLENRTLRVAMLNPRDARAISEVRAVSGCRVEPWVTTEHRLDQALERHYRVEREGRPRVSLSVPSASPSVDPSPAPLSPPRRRTEEREPEIGLDGRPLDSECGFDYELYATMSHLSDLSEGAGPDPARPAVVPAESPPEDPFDRLGEALAAASDREEIAEAVLEFCATRASRSALFSVGKEGIRGLAGRGPGMESERVRKVDLSPHGSTFLDAALQSRGFHFGVVPPLPANRDLYSILGGRLPATALAIPVAVKERTVALIYLDDGDRPITRPDIPLMLRVASKAGLALEILLLRGKLRRS